MSAIEFQQLLPQLGAVGLAVGIAPLLCVDQCYVDLVGTAARLTPAEPTAPAATGAAGVLTDAGLESKLQLSMGFTTREEVAKALLGEGAFSDYQLQQVTQAVCKSFNKAGV
eukprot:gene31185-9228_t